MYQPDSVWEFATADRIKFGRGAVAELGDALAARGVEGLLVVTDEQLRAAGVVDSVLDALPEGVDVDVFDGVEPDPGVVVYEAAIDAAESAAPDAVVGVGGGSSMDVGKVAGALAGAGATCWTTSRRRSAAATPSPTPR